MRWVSNKESVSKGEPSVLAIVESLVAMGLSLWIAVHFGTVQHVVIGACIAPFLLLRTNESAALGIRVDDWLGEQFDRLPDWNAWLLIYPLLLAFVPIRVFVTTVTLVRSPAAVVRAIPRNWRRIAVATDFCRSPQFLPTPDDPTLIKLLLVDDDRNDLYSVIRTSFGKAEYEASLNDIRFRILLLRIWTAKWLLVVPLVGLPAILYRLSLKSTAIIWFPLLWALRPVAPSDEPLKVRLQLFEKSDLFRIVLFVSGAALLLFTSKLILWNEIAQASNTWNESIGGRILSIHVAPGVIEWWQIATALNSAIAIGLWLYVRSCLRHDEAGVPRRETVVERLLVWGLFVRRLLTTYTILCVGYLYLREAVAWQLPPLGGNPFPWM